MTTQLLDTMAALEDTFTRFQAFRAQKPKRQLLRAHTAYTAQSIVKYVLSQRGWTKRWKGGDLSGRQHISLLEDCRQYGRSRLRHEAEQLFEWHGVEDESEISVRSNIYPGEDRDRLEGRLQGSNGNASGRIDRSIASRAKRSVASFFDRARIFIRELVTAGAMILKGNEPLTEAELLAIDRQARKQHEYLEGFEREVQAQPPRELSDLSTQVIDMMPDTMSMGQFIARAESYGNAAWEVQNIGRQETLKRPFEFERRVHFLSLEEHRPCKTCKTESNKGWVPVGTLNEIGDSECLNNCDCYFEWMSAGKIYVSPWGRHNPRGFNQPGDPGSGLPGFAVPPDVQSKTSEPPAPEPQPKPESLPAKDVPKPKPAKSDKPAPARPIPTIEEIITDAGSAHPVEYYEEL